MSDLPLPCLVGLPPAASALARWQEQRGLHLQGQVQLKARNTSQQEEQPGSGALQAQGLFLQGSL